MQKKYKNLQLLVRVTVSVFSIVFFSLQLISCARTSSIPQPPVLSKPLASWQKVWSRLSLTSTHGQYLPMPMALSVGRLYASDAGGKVTALDASNGNIIWQRHTNTAITSGVAIGRGDVFVGTAAGNLIALNSNTGAMQWFQTVSSSIIAPPLAAAGHVYIKTESSDVYAYQASQGHIVWNFPVASPGLTLRLGGAAAVYGGDIIIGFANGQVASLDQQSGFPHWRMQLSRPQGTTVVARMVDVDVAPLVVGNTVYIASYQGRVVALNAASGRVLWQHKLSTFSGLAVDDKSLYVTDVAGDLWALSRKDGSVLWKQSVLQGRGASAPAVVNGHIVVGDAGGYLYAFQSNNGNLQAMTHVTRSSIIAAPLVYKNMVIVSAQNGRVKAYRYQKTV